MNTWRCADCDTEFTAERSTACLKCGSPAVFPILSEKATPEASAPRREADPGEMTGILRDLCRTAYESTYNGHEWEDAINRTMVKLQPFMKDLERVKG